MFLGLSTTGWTTAIITGLVLSGLFLLILQFMDKRKKRRLLKKYKPEDDKGKKPKGEKREFLRGESGIEEDYQESSNPNTSDVGLEQLKRRELLSSTNVDDDGKVSSSKRKTSKGNRGFLRRRRR